MYPHRIGLNGILDGYFGWGIMKMYVSRCHGAEVLIESTVEGSDFFCSKCRKPCKTKCSLDLQMRRNEADEEKGVEDAKL